MLVLVDQDRLLRFDEPRRVVPHRRSRSQVITVEHRSSQVPGQLAEQGALTYGTRPVEDHHRLFGEPSFHDLSEPSPRETGQHSVHVPSLPVLFRDSAIYFPRLQTKFSVSPRHHHVIPTSRLSVSGAGYG